ncbi:NTTRR-F1 domain [Paenibacillus medicaginis]|uniref:NTTRR-F1 domain n=1 Tax=Paenibacillus medicaginis TaxID=1470560 RepID=A0ABV5C1T8_9BACL
MPIQNRIVNGGFESGTLFPWITMNAVVTSQFSHSGMFSARLQGGPVISYLAQFVPANSGATGATGTGSTGATGATGVTGPIGLFSQFQVSENAPNTTGSSAIPVGAAPITLKTITITGVPAGGRIWLTGIVGWESIVGDTIFQLQVLRGQP